MTEIDPLSDLEESILREFVRRESLVECKTTLRIEYTFPVPGVPGAPGVLPVWSTNQKLSRYPEAALRKAWRRNSHGAAKNIGPITGLWLFTMELPFRTKQRRDPMNYVGTVLKSVADGMTDAGIWPDDTPEFVRVLDPDIVIQQPAETVKVRLLKLGDRVKAAPSLFE